MKKILILGDANSSHIEKWVTAIAAKGYIVKIFSLTIYTGNSLKEKGIEVVNSAYASKRKILYPLAVDELWQLIKDFKPDLLHAHYASSYGLLGALSRFHPYILSVWGSDVYSFPQKSSFHKRIFKFNLKKADKICSTSNSMKEEIKKYTGKDISVIPFGVDLNAFKPMPVHHVFKGDAVVIGTVKTLEKEYGLEYLVEAFALLKKRAKEFPLKLLIVGKGSLEMELKEKAQILGIQADVVFTGYIAPVEVPYYQNMLTISVFPSLSESFGVSVVEAMACEKPVIATNVGGLPEVVENNVTGIIVPPANVEKLAEAIETLVRDEQLRSKFGKEGRSRVERLYNWDNNLASMIEIYETMTSQKGA